MRGSPGEGPQKEPGPPRRPGQCGRASLEWLSPRGTLEGRVTQALSLLPLRLFGFSVTLSRTYLNLIQ